MGIVNISKIGLREVTYEDIESIENPQTRMRSFRTVKKTRLMAQPWLELEEAKVLAEADWKEQPDGTFMCVFLGRRFMCKENPVEKPIPEKVTYAQPVTGDAEAVKLNATEKNTLKNAEAALASGKKLSEMTEPQQRVLAKVKGAQ